MSADLDEVRQTVFRETGIPLGDKDPLMAQHALNRILIAELNASQEQLLDAFKSDLEGIAFQWGNDAKDKAERILNASLTASKAAMSDLLRAGIQEATAHMLAELEEARRKTERHSNATKNWSIVNTIASIVALLAALVVAWSKAM
jgi:molecular chaperone GrpE (heat shock protein)